MPIKRKTNITTGDIFKAPCIVCSGTTDHEVMLSIDDFGEEHEKGFDFYWNNHHQIIQCQGCKAVSFRKASSNSEEYEPVDDENWEPVVYEDLYPPRVEGRNGLIQGTHYLPLKVHQIYKETQKALSNRSPVLTGIGVRAPVETVCKEKEALGRTLSEKIDNLVEKLVLTPESAKILHKLRALGNSAAHEATPHTEKQLGLAMDVVDHLLKDVYIIPKQIKFEFEDE